MGRIPTTVVQHAVRVSALSLALATGFVAGSVQADAITQYPVPSGAVLPYGIAVGSDGNIWFAEYVGDKIGKMTPGGVFLGEYPIPTSASRPAALILGPDGNLWFTEYNGGKIGRITTAGLITEFPVPSGGPYGLAAGADGNLWFSELNSNLIVKMSTSGTVLNSYSASAYGVASGPDGNIWFAATNAIGKIAPSGTITRYPVPNVNADVMNIASGPDGNVWFTEYSGNKVGKITPAGIITEYAIPTPSSDPEGISGGPDGNVWFVENAGGNLARVTPDGAITEFPFSNAPWENPGATITGSANGDVWFTFGATNSLYRVTTLQSPLVSVTFSPSYVALSSTANDRGPSELTITLSNPNPTALTGVSFTDVFPTGLYGTFATSTCGGTLSPSTSTFTFATLSGGSIPPNGSCWVGIDVYPNATGKFTDSSGAVSSDNAPASAGANAVLTVRQPPTVPGASCSPSVGCN